MSMGSQLLSTWCIVLAIITVAAVVRGKDTTASISYRVLENTDTGLPPGTHAICAASKICGKRSCVPPHIPGPTCDIQELEAACRQTPHCAGFNSDGWLKPCVNSSCGAKSYPFTDVDTYIGSSTLPGPFPPAPAPPIPPPTPPQPEPSIPNIPDVDDWHYPNEEATQMQSLYLIVDSVNATSNMSGSVTFTLPNGTVTVRSIGSAVYGWKLRGMLANFNMPTPQVPCDGQYSSMEDGLVDVAILSKSFERWGYIVYVTSGSRLQPAVGNGVSCGWGFRTGIGTLQTTRRPHYNLTGVTSSYFTDAANDPEDFVRRIMESKSSFNETTFQAAMSLLPPSHDYGLTGNVDSHTKFSIAQDGRVRLANFSIYTASNVGNETDGNERGVLVFDPRNYVKWWPKTNFSDYKTSLIGRMSRAINIAVWDQQASEGFIFEAVPNTIKGIETNPYDFAELLVRLEESGKDARYFSVLGCIPQGFDRQAPPIPPQPQVLCNTHQSTVSELHDGGALFHANLLRHCENWNRFHDSNKTMAVRLHYSSEGSRIVDMGRATISSAMTTFVGDRPNYGDGTNYWSVSQKDRGSLPLESYALDHALLLWGQIAAASMRVKYYFQHYVRNASGLTPQALSGVPSSEGPPGSIDLKHWEDACWFADSLADYGRWISLWVEVARATQADGSATWVQSTWPQVKLMAQYMLGLQANASTSGPGKGLIYGPAEHDTCRSQTNWFSISAWTWRGFIQLTRYLGDTDAIDDPIFNGVLVNASNDLKAALDAALDISVVRDAKNKVYFVPPYAAEGFKSYDSMVQQSGTTQQMFGGGPSYANFRYYSEMLSAQFMGNDIDVALNEFREDHSGTLSGMTRFRDHLDDMPATGYAFSAIATDRRTSYLSLMFGHIANYQARGTFNAPEQLSLYGDGGENKTWVYSDSYRAMLDEGRNEVDIDTCVPSTTLVALMLRWLLVFVEQDTDTIWLLKMAPRRMYSAPHSLHEVIAVERAYTRYGAVSFTVTQDDTPSQNQLIYVVNISIAGTGLGFINGKDSKARSLFIKMRLRDPSGEKILRNCSSSSPAVGIGTINATDESVTLQMDRTYLDGRPINFNVIVTLKPAADTYPN